MGFLLPSAWSISASALHSSPPARDLIPAAFAALLGTFEPFSAPIWVWLIHAEVPSARTIVGGAVVVTALLVHIGLEFKRQTTARAAGSHRRAVA